MAIKSSSQVQKGVPQGMIAESSGENARAELEKTPKISSPRDGEIHSGHYHIH